MSKLNRKDYLNISFLVLLYLIIVLVLTHGQYLYGSTVDWETQHWAIPEYFRNLFYYTNELLPNFAPNLGGGQNIFYFAYYGFLSPIILISYLFPNVQMHDYISLSSMLMVILSVILLYKWLKNNNFKTSICFAVSLLFLCAGPLIFQSHRHIMFMNYMPFLIMAFMAIDSYFQTGKRALLIASTFLIIMTSYFYSVGALLSIIIYGVYIYLRKNRNTNIKQFVKAAFLFAIPIIVAILMACILLLPVIYVLLNGRIHGDVPLNIFNLIIPHFGLEYILYSPYSVGLGAIVVIALFCNLMFRKIDNLFLNITLIAIVTANVFVYILNGTLYLDGKALIPLLPLYCLVIAKFLNRVISRRLAFYNILSMFAITVILAIIFASKEYALLYIIDGLFVIYLINFYYKSRSEQRLFIPLIIVSLIICLGVNVKDQLVEIHQKQNNEEITQLAKYALDHDNDYYRIYSDIKGTTQSVNRILDPRQNLLTLYSSTYNKEYNRFFYHTFNNNIKYRNSVITHENDNIMFETFMGVKYLITNKVPSIGYQEVRKGSNYTLYVNENSLPIGYASNQILSEEQYNALKYPFKLEALMNNIIVPQAENKTIMSHMEKIKLHFKKEEIINLDIDKQGKTFHVKTKNDKPGYINLTLNQQIKNKLLLIRVHISNPQSCTLGDTSITINGVKNKLTCREWKYYNHNQTFDYTLSSPKTIENLKIKFAKGEYTINNIQIYTIDYNRISSLKENVDEFQINTKNTYGDKISGIVDVKNDGYFVLSIPYDEGFTIKVDGKKVYYEKVNGAFIGFPIKKGYHTVDITYVSPNFKFGKKISIIGLALFIIIVVYDFYFKNKKRRRKKTKNV